MGETHRFFRAKRGLKRPHSSNVKSTPKYERFGETIRYMTLEELRRFFDSIEDYGHKLMLRMVYELGCRVAEFVRIQLKHLDFGRSMVLFPAENTKTGWRRTSYLPRGLMNEIVSLLRQQGRMNKRDLQLRQTDSYLFRPPGRRGEHYTENRLRQIFRRYADRAGLSQEYGQDSKGRTLHRLTIHSLRHTHVMLGIHHYQLPLPIVQRQVGHRSLHSTSVYLNPSDEAVAQAYGGVERKNDTFPGRREHHSLRKQTNDPHS